MKTLDEEEPAQKESLEAEGKARNKSFAHLPHLPAVGFAPRMPSTIECQRKRVKCQSLL
jgi:hypothetical protein